MGGGIRQGTRLWSNDPIVLEHPELFTDASTVPGPGTVDGPTEARPSGPEWIAIVRAYRASQSEAERRPSQETVAKAMGIGERSLRNKVQDLGIASWHAVHALVASED